MSRKTIIILAAGKGNRMKSEKPKVLHEVKNKSMLDWVVGNCKLYTDNIILVYSDLIENYVEKYKPDIKLAKQEEPKGTAHATACALDFISETDVVGVIYGDNPLINTKIISQLFDHLESSKSDCVTLAFENDSENQYGRIVTDARGEFKSIVESKFASPEQSKITLCNSGIMAFAPSALHKYLPFCLKHDESHPDRELYLTDIIEHCVKNGGKVDYYKTKNKYSVLGVNTQKELKIAEEILDRENIE